MKGRVIALGQWRGRDAAALIVDGVLEDFIVDDAAETPGIGAICRAVVNRQMKGQGGVFLRLPGHATGFLREAGGLHPGQVLVVQVSGHAEPGKALPVSQRLLFKGRQVIVTPGVAGINIARSIRSGNDRDRLSALAAAAMAGRPADLGLILRTAAAQATDEEISAEITELADLAQAVGADLSGGPELLLDAPGAHDIAWRDWAEPVPDELATGPTAFDDHGIATMLDALLSAEVRLGAGSVVIEPTRALVAVDVNTGGDSSPAAGMKANIAAARELPRQLRLRGLGGQVVIDFAPMPKKDRHVLEQVLRAAFKGDGAETSLAGWTTLGNFELQRKRDRRPLAAMLADPPADPAP